jgi:hypothetical protein
MDHRFNAAIACCLSCYLVACGPSFVPPKDAPKVEGDCASACSNLASLGCPEGKEPDCVDFCEASQASGGAVLLAVGCASEAKSVEEARYCRVECAQ